MLQLEKRWLEVLPTGRSPHHFRHGIAILLEKGESAVRQDKYERYDDVVRPTFQAAYADLLYSFEGRRPLHDFLEAPLQKAAELEGPLLELGCGTGRLLWEMLQKGPNRWVLGLDFSYNMLRQAADLLLKGRLIEMDARARGFGQKTLQLPAQERLSLGQADVEKLPLVDQHFSFVLQSFLLDRLNDPLKGLQESLRVLRKGGQLVVLSPLNFQRAEHWEKLGDPQQIREILKAYGARIIRQETFVIWDALDARMNRLHWNCLGIWAEKC